MLVVGALVCAGCGTGDVAALDLSCLCLWLLFDRFVCW